MNQCKYVYSSVIVAAIAASVGLALPFSALAQSPASLFQGVIDFLRSDVEDSRRGSNGGSRGSGPFCVLNPGNGETLWSLQPLFVVRGDVEEMAVHALNDAGNDSGELWRVSVTSGESDLFQARYEGLPLQPGEEYEWLFYQSFPGRAQITVLRLPFQVMAAGTERDLIATELAQLETKLEAQRANSEAIAAARSDYFFAKGLPADGVQEFFMLDSPSDALIETREAIVEDICN